MKYNANILMCATKAIFLRKTLGTKVAAAYLRNRGFSPLAAIAILAKGH